jgi:hypothetical protein
MVYLILAFVRQVFVMVGAVAQLGEHLLCKQGVSGSIPLSSTNSLWCRGERQTYPLKKIKVCITSMKCCLFCKNREEKIDLEASRYGFRPMSDAGSNDVVDGLAGRIRKRGRSR